MVVVKSKRMAAEDVVELELVDPQGGDLPAFTAGAHIDLHIKPDMIRQYSLANNPSERHRYLIDILVERDGRGGSKAIFEALGEGDTLVIGLPRNHFPLVEEAPFSLLVAGGIGITPLVAMAYRLRDSGKSFKLFYRAHSRAKAAYADRLEQEFGNSVVCLFSDEGGRERFDIAAALRNAPPGSHLYLCGSNGFMEFVAAAAKNYLPEAQIHLEHFSAPVSAKVSPNRAFELYCAKSKVTLSVPADKSIVEVLDANGIDVPVSCAEGICGTCISQFIEGEVDHRDSVLTRKEREEKKLFTPCCSRAKGNRLVMDV